jgi:hypothetical protein
MNDHRYRNHDGDLDPNVIAHELDEAGKAYAHAKHAADLLEGTNAAVRAQLTNEKRRENPDASRKECEDMALGSPEWTTHVYATADAVREKNIALARWKAVQARFEAMRTAESTRRAQMNMR